MKKLSLGQWICWWLEMIGLVAVFVSVLVIGIDTIRPAVHAQAHGTASEEVPRGAIDGINTVFTLNFQPAPWASIHVYLNGLRLHRNYDYVLGGPNMEQIQFAPPATAPTINIPLPGDLLLVDYTY